MSRKKPKDRSLILQITSGPEPCTVTWNNYPAMPVRSCSERLHRRPKQRDTLRLPNSSVQLPNPGPFIESCIKAINRRSGRLTKRGLVRSEPRVCSAKSQTRIPRSKGPRPEED